jgi:hypothetical protein
MRNDVVGIGVSVGSGVEVNVGRVVAVAVGTTLFVGTGIIVAVGVGVVVAQAARKTIRIPQVTVSLLKVMFTLASINRHCQARDWFVASFDCAALRLHRVRLAAARWTG